MSIFKNICDKFTVNQIVEPGAACCSLEDGIYLIDRMARVMSDLTAPSVFQPQVLLGNDFSPIISTSYQGKKNSSLSSLVEKAKLSASDEAAIRLAMLQTGAAIAGD